MQFPNMEALQAFKDDKELAEKRKEAGAVLESAGVKDVLAKSKGSSNPHNLVKATLKALLELRDARTVAMQRGVKMDKVFNG